MLRTGRRCRVVALAVALVATACTGGGDGAEGPTDTPSTAVDSEQSAGWDGRIDLGLVGVQSLDPASVSPASVSDIVLVDLLYDTLTELDDAGRVQPGLATVSANANRTRWRFELLPEATFADGSRVTAADVVFSLERIRAQGPGSLAGLQLEDVVSVSAVGVGAVEVELRTPSAVLPEILSAPQYGIVAERALQDADPGRSGPIASGDYATEVTSTTELALTRRSGTGPATVHVHLYEDDGAAFDDFLAGSLDWSPIPFDRFGEALDTVGDGGLTPFAGTILLAVNERVPPLEAAPLRQAIAMAIDRDTLAAAVFGPAAQPLLGLLPAGAPGANTDCVGPCGPEPATAEALVESVVGAGQRVTLRMLTNESDTDRAIAGVLQEQLAGAGIDLQVTSLDSSTVDQLVSAGQQQLFLFSTLGVGRSAATLLRTPFASGSPDNLLRFQREAVDAAIQAAITDPVPVTRAAAWRSVEARVLAEVPVVPLVQLRTVAAVSPRIDGLVIRVDGSIDLSGVRPAA